MSIFDIFKHKKEKVEKKSIEKKAVTKLVQKKEVINPIHKKVKKVGIAAKVLESPHVTEKASLLAESNKYTFKVAFRSNKIEIKKGVEELYGVDVVGVNIINIHRKKRRVGRKFGFKTGYKKAIVEIKKGQKIEVMPR